MDVAAFAVELAARRSKAENATSALDQPRADLGFEPLERQADGRLTQQQAVRRRGDPTLISDDHEGAQQVPVQLSDEFFSQIGRHGLS